MRSKYKILLFFKLGIFCLFSFFITNCYLNSGGGAIDGNGVRVDMVYVGSTIVSSGRLHIRLRGDEEYICRKRPLTPEIIREELEKVAVPEEVIEEYFATEEETQTEDTEASTDAIKHQVGDNWIKFGLRIRNTTSNALIVTDISMQAKGKCGEEEYSPSLSEIGEGYCGSNYLYVVPPTGLNAAVNYEPNGSPIENLTLFFDGFEILDNRQSDPDFEYPKGCRENETQKVAIPEYKGNLIVRGYFIGNTDDLVRVDFTETVPFTLSTRSQ